ncbi:MAG: hypothetical protein NTX45_23185 [Proteobacteria bacterium]|nr:hypothetical protein [Pseudomonadota bacterium]
MFDIAVSDMQDFGFTKTALAVLHEDQGLLYRVMPINGTIKIERPVSLIVFFA